MAGIVPKALGDFHSLNSYNNHTRWVVLRSTLQRSKLGYKEVITCPRHTSANVQHINPGGLTGESSLLTTIHANYMLPASHERA